MATYTEDVAGRVAAVHEEVWRLCERAGRDPAGVTIVGVTKGQPVTAVLQGLAAGLRDFGENYVQELARKSSAVEAYCRSVSLEPPVWHFIGHLQRNKLKLALHSGIRVLHSLDSTALLAEIERQSVSEHGKDVLDCYIQVNLSDDPAKHGLIPEQLAPLLGAAGRSSVVRVLGLMTIAPDLPDPELVRPVFRRLRELAAAHGLRGLSMGMTNDYRVALEEGATVLRIGRAIFGERPNTEADASAG